MCRRRFPLTRFLAICQLVLPLFLAPANDLFGAESVWKYQEYVAGGKTTPASSFRFSDGAAALETLGLQHWSGLETPYYLYNYMGLVSVNCNGSTCSARPRYEMCYKPSGMRPDTRGKWKYDYYNLKSDYTFGSGEAALLECGQKAFNKTTSTTSIHFLSLENLACTTSGNPSCTANARYKVCNTYLGQSLATENKWRHQGAGWGIVPPSQYIYDSGEEALNTLGEEYYGRETASALLYFLGLTGMSCGPDPCTAKARYKACFKAYEASVATEGLWRHGEINSYGPLLVAPKSGYAFGDARSALNGAGEIAFNATASSGVTYTYKGLVEPLSCRLQNNGIRVCEAFAKVQICDLLAGCSISDNHFKVVANSGDCKTNVSLEMVSDRGVCKEYVSASKMGAYEGSCPIVNGPQMYAESKSSQYFVRYPEKLETDCTKSGTCAYSSCTEIGNPINIANGNKRLETVDLSFADGLR